MNLSVHQYRQKRIEMEKREFGFADMVSIEAAVKRYAEARAKHKKSLQDTNFDPFTDDPNCKSCKKKKK